MYIYISKETCIAFKVYEILLIYMIFPAKEKQFSNISGFTMTVGNPENNTM